MGHTGYGRENNVFLSIVHAIAEGGHNSSYRCLRKPMQLRLGREENRRLLCPPDASRVSAVMQRVCGAMKDHDTRCLRGSPCFPRSANHVHPMTCARLDGTVGSRPFRERFPGRNGYRRRYTWSCRSHVCDTRREQGYRIRFVSISALTRF
ncbi:hypothetical protein BDW02DRAFT_230418 [Decorospora gaudefroyi]|uniref:Uncharacterized protein n=1 Tax=Decorospora gaudefroyi TaxID=184978 RepID=A0A6A5KW01_9PLEO|nr:hypothetical protein BDW02DRAFT_230418 [Decorospora gaudefroyi]